MIAAADIRSETDLSAWLLERGFVPVGGAKDTADLWAEIVRGESRMADNPPRREVTLVQVMLRRGPLVLLELAQELRDGAIRHRRIPPSEKLVAGETAEAAAWRCLREEVGLSAVDVSDLRVVGDPASHRLDSPSYPGLPTDYTIFTVEAVAPGLPSVDFWRDNHDAGPSDRVRRHLWGWRAEARF